MDMFNQYNDQKRLHDDVYDSMREKIDVITKEIRENSLTPSFTTINLGSYATKTGVEYNNNEYDIDVGIRLNIKSSQLATMTASNQKEIVYDAIKNHRIKKFRTMCLTAIYQIDNKPKYHLDFPIYAYDNEKDEYYIAKGKKGNVVWEKCEPKKLIDYLKYDEADEKLKKLYRRIIRFLKLWKSKVFSDKPDYSCPPSIAFNLIARDYFANTTTNDDIDCLIDLVKLLLRKVNDEVTLNLPFLPYSNVFYKMNTEKKYVEIYYTELNILLDKLQEAKELSRISLEQSCYTLRKVFPDFPLPPKEEVKKSFSPSASYGKNI